MKQYRVTMTLTVDGEGEETLMNVKKDILSGELQRELVSKKEGIHKVKATFEQLK